jgi:hypothetical protein
VIKPALRRFSIPWQNDSGAPSTFQRFRRTYFTVSAIGSENDQIQLSLIEPLDSRRCIGSPVGGLTPASGFNGIAAN